MVPNNNMVLNRHNGHTNLQNNKPDAYHTDEQENTKHEEDDKKPSHQQQTYQGGAAGGKDSDEDKNQPNIPGPNEVPDQQKVGE